MDRLAIKRARRGRRRMRVRRRVFGTPERPRLTVFRSLKHVYAQLVDDAAGRTLVEASTRGKELAGSVGYGGNKAAAKQVGTLLAERAKSKGVESVVFDRNGYRYHGRIKALADAVRESGLKF